MMYYRDMQSANVVCDVSVIGEVLVYTDRA